MALLDLCSNNSYWRGLDYYENKRVKNLNQISKYEFEAEVEGSKVYQVHLDANHQRKCTCSCPHAAGRYVVCKHKVAVYFAAFPEEAQKAIDERNRYFEEQEEREREYDRRVKAERKRVLERRIIEEGRQLKQEQDDYRRTLERIKREKLNEMEKYHIDPKYRVDLQKYKIK